MPIDHKNEKNHDNLKCDKESGKLKQDKLDDVVLFFFPLNRKCDLEY